jgi:hypothetical protein
VSASLRSVSSSTHPELVRIFNSGGSTSPVLPGIALAPLIRATAYRAVSGWVTSIDAKGSLWVISVRPDYSAGAVPRGSTEPVVTTASDGTAAEATGYTPRTELGRKLWALRERIVESGVPLLSEAEIERELAEARRQPDDLLPCL